MHGGGELLRTLAKAGKPVGHQPPGLLVFDVATDHQHHVASHIALLVERTQGWIVQVVECLKRTLDGVAQRRMLPKGLGKEVEDDALAILRATNLFEDDQLLLPEVFFPQGCFHQKLGQDSHRWCQPVAGDDSGEVRVLLCGSCFQNAAHAFYGGEKLLLAAGAGALEDEMLCAVGQAERKMGRSGPLQLDIITAAGANIGPHGYRPRGRPRDGQQP